MPNVDQCLILAAGNGSRLVSSSGTIPKPLVKLHGKPLLEHIMLRAQEAGIRKFVIVIGFRGDAIRRWFAQRPLAGVEVTLVENPEYHKDNGVSVLKARDEIRNPFLLLMSDHLFEPRTAKSLLQQPLGQGEVILAVDPNIDTVFDLDDATKVMREGDHIVEIGKQISHYDAFDTGMFLCSPQLFGILESAKKNGNCSLSDGMRKLAQAGKFLAFDIGDAAWQDVDTPEALAYAEMVFDQYFRPTALTEEFANV
ncbi:MAG: NTP transferase domain-containing protein [Candidatus Korobacteraceae bacterium]